MLTEECGTQHVEMTNSEVPDQGRILAHIIEWSRKLGVYQSIPRVGKADTTLGYARTKAYRTINLGIAPQIHGMTKSANPATLDEAVEA
ncbi:hypothetical protein L1987_15903 [Smallanthus sonchifolius]|uniref:Uncharacterized protein n=1 Tax=Smallanthus sonchifolius TaxID=185202 RepID=A0ACB9J7V8_9ASTR|nr:hypothetical protein L1987_15903 [Smallanthus sonchifolius]